MYTASGGGGLPPFGTGDTPLSPDPGIPSIGDYVRERLREIEGIEQWLPHIAVAVEAGRLVLKVYNGLTASVGSGTGFPPFVEPSDLLSLTRRLEELIKEGRIPALRGAVVVPPAFFGVDP